MLILKGSSSLSDVYSRFVDDVNSFVQFWDEMSLLDERCWILEPNSKPSPVETTRRIALNPSCSVRIRVDPRNPRELPYMEFCGSETDTGF